MGKKIKVLILVMSIVCLAASGALAGTTKVNHGAVNTGFTAALEAMGAARNMILLGAANGPVTFLTTQNITTANFLSVSLDGAQFTGGPYRLCLDGKAGAGNLFGVGTPASGATSYNFQFDFGGGNAISAGNVIHLTSDPLCVATGANNLDMRLAAQTGTANPTITIGIVSAGNIPVDPASTAQLFHVRPQYAAAVNAGAHVVDYLGSPGTGINFTVEPTGANNRTSLVGGAVNIVRTALNFNTTNTAGGGVNAALTVGATVNLTDNAGWQGVSKVFLSNVAAGNCTDNAGNNAVGTGAPSSTVTLAVPQAAFNGASTALSLCIAGNGTDSLAPRVIQGNVALSVGAGGVTPSPTAYSNVDVWTLNAYQTWVSWLVNAEGARTSCLINNADTTRTAAVILDVVSSEGATTTITNRNMGTIAARTSNMATFTANSASLTGGTAVDITALGVNARYAPKLTVTGSPANISVQCIQVDPVTGARRPVNTLQNAGTWTY